MAKLVWDNPDERAYESGISHGVLYPRGKPGVAWNGLVSVTHQPQGGKISNIYMDGIKYREYVEARDFQAKLTCYEAPLELNPALGLKPIAPGIIVTRQPKESFDLVYRTWINGGPDYKLHMIWNASIVPSSISHKTTAKDPNVETVSWTINAVPPYVTNYKPTPYLVLDTRNVDPSVLMGLNKLLYGTDFGGVPQLPTQAAVKAWVQP